MSRPDDAVFYRGADAFQLVECRRVASRPLGDFWIIPEQQADVELAHSEPRREHGHRYLQKLQVCLAEFERSEEGYFSVDAERRHIRKRQRKWFMDFGAHCHGEWGSQLCKSQ